MDFDLSSRSEIWRGKLQAFFDAEILPRHRAWLDHAAKGEVAPFMGDLQRKARAAGLWNLGLPELADDEPGTRLSNLEYVYPTSNTRRWRKSWAGCSGRRKSSTARRPTCPT
jgi:acyl-CoA dehydrogenase